ncbi:MAG TPA: ribbon-helix-helix protein, CopG family [Candidatus Sulfotelmatobacter sp.]|nr:ribbon-helix-helix protein, CopG family [Candidatus Sulfotelmatobacter sp.]
MVRSQAEIVPLDAEDIALARLQADLRKIEGVRKGSGQADASRCRTSIRLPAEMLTQLRRRAERERVTLSALIGAALARHFKDL